jgi:hypothetical protein
MKFVDSATCDREANIEHYEKGIYLYHIDEILKVNGDINADNEDDFIVRYEAGNCWRGIGASNYLSNVFL